MIVADLVNFAQIIVLRLGDDYIVPKRRLAADSYPPPSGIPTMYYGSLLPISRNLLYIYIYIYI